jgi:hypothetical protein
MSSTRFALGTLFCGAVGAVALIAQAPPAAEPPQFFLGRLSDSMCGASHQAKAAALKVSERECLFECIKALAKYVLVDADGKVVPIANQDAMGIPLYAGRPVRLTGAMKDGAIVVAKVEAIPAHLHIGHVMTNWRDTPGTRGFLPVAVDEARVAMTHAKLAVKAASPADMQLHAGHVINALDPSVVADGPGAKYGVKKAATGALQHLEFAVKAEGVTRDITTHAEPVSSALADALKTTDQALDVAQKARASSDSAEIARLISDLDALVTRLASELQQALSHMSLILKAEGLEGAPR